jgi:hypothetical protein
MGIIKPALKRREEISAALYDEIAPFVPAYDLYKSQSQDFLSDAEIASIAMTLYFELPDSSNNSSEWGRHALHQQFSQRR